MAQPTKKCEVCNDTGIAPRKEFSEKLNIEIPKYYCNCEMGTAAKVMHGPSGDAENKRILNERKEKIERALKRCNIAKRFSETGINDLDSEKVKKLAEKYYNDWDNRQKNGFGLYFWGGVGSGKTFCAMAIANDIRRNKMVEMLYFSFTELVYRMKKGYEPDSRFDPHLLDAIKKCELLVIDDIGLEKATEWVTEQLYMIINHRYEQMLPTIITSNQSPEDLGKLHNEQIASRLKEMSTVVKFTGKDRRETKPLTVK